MKRYFLLSLMLLPILLMAVSVTASVNKTELSLAERLQYTIQIKSDSAIKVSEPSPPVIELFTFVNMTSSARSSTTMSGLRVQTEHLKSYTYYYIPQREGTATIPPQNIQIGNKVYSTRKLTVTVVKSVAQAPAQGSQPLQPGFDFEDPDLPWSANRIAGSTLILAFPQRQKVYKGQPAVVSYYLYTDQMVRSFNLDDEKDFPGYGKSIYEQPKILEYETVTHQGKRFQRALIKRLMLLPNETGELQAPLVQGRARIYEFGYLNQTVRSNAAWLEVLPLPKDGVPADFSGAVGSFEVSETLSATEISLGEAITFSLRIAGQGNFNQFGHPQFSQSSAQISAPMAIDRLNAGVEGSRTLYYTIIPSEKGTYILPKLSFSWYDTERGAYRNFESKAHEIQVKSANVISYFSSLLDAGKPQTLRPMLSRNSYPDFRNMLTSIWYWLVVAITLVATAFSAYLAWHKAEKRTNPVLYAQKNADKLLKKYLHQASTAVKDLSPDFYALAETGLMHYLSEKYGVSNRLSTDEKIAKLQDKNIPKELLQDTERFVEICNRQRFSPEKKEATQLLEDYRLLRSIVTAYSKTGSVK